MNENVNVCITPKGDKPVLHFSQFDNERVFTVTVLADEGKSAAVLTGLDIEFRLRKTDSHVVIIAPESVADNVITFKSTEQMCACCGQNIASVVLMKDDMIVSTLDILVDIQRDILSGGLTSESDIRNLTTQIEQIVPEVIGDDYYNKQEVDDLLAEHTFDPSNYYNKSDVDGLLDDKADSDDVYTKTEADELLADKADKSAIASLIVQKDVTKAPVASFNTDLAEALTKCIVEINPVQSGTGTPSPQNVRPISGFSALNVTRTGKNLLSGTLEDYQSSTRTYGLSTFIAYKLPNGTYTVSTNAPTGYIWTGKSFDNGPLDTSSYLRVYEGNPMTITLSGKQDLIVGVLTADKETALSYNTQLELGNQASEYHAYNGQTASVNFGQTVYGGVADVTNGKVTVTHALTPLNNKTWVKSGNKFYTSGFDKAPAGVLYTDIFDCAIGIPTNKEWNSLAVGECCLINGLYSTNKWSFVYCTDAYATVEEFVSALNADCTITYPLATPIEITTTPENLTALSGQNNVYGDTNGDTAVRFTETIGNELGV